MLQNNVPGESTILVSVLIPVYNVTPYLMRCLRSVLNGTYHNIEVICVDDGSTDNSGAMLDEIAAEDERVKILHTKNRGLPSARQLGLQEARGNYIAFIDSDDYVHNRYIEVLIGNAVKYNADVVYCSYKRFSNKPVSDAEDIADAVIAETYFYDGYFRKYAWGRVYKRELLKKPFFGQNEDFQDSIFNMSNVGDILRPSIYYIKTPMYYYFQRKGSLSTVQGQENRFFNTLQWIYEGEPEERNDLLYYQGFLWALFYRWYMLLQKNTDGVADMNIKLSFFLERLDHSPQISFRRKIAYHLLKRSPHLYAAIRLMKDRSMIEWRKCMMLMTHDNTDN